MAKRPVCDPGRALSLLRGGASQREIASKLGVSRKAVANALKRGAEGAPGAPPSPPAVASSGEREALLASAQALEGMARTSPHPRDRIAAYEAARRAWRRLTELDAIEAAAKAAEEESPDLQWVHKRLEGYRRQNVANLRAAVQGLPVDRIAAICAAVHIGIAEVTGVPVAELEDDEEGAHAAAV